MDDLQGIALAVKCPRCGAMGFWCTTKTGKSADNLHAGRIDPIITAYWAGYRDACKSDRKVVTP